MERTNKDGNSRTRRRLWIAVVLGVIFTGIGVVLTFFSIEVIPQGEGPHVTGLVGGGQAENGGVTLQIGNYSIIAGIPEYAGASVDTIQPACLNASQVINKKSTQDTQPLTVDPIGVTECLANGQSFNADSGRLTVTVEDIGAIQAKTGATQFLPLSKISASVQQTTQQTAADTGSLLLLAVGTGLAAGALIGLAQSRNTEAPEHATVGAEHRSPLPGGDNQRPTEVTAESPAQVVDPPDPR